MYYRKLRSLDIESICEDILTSPLLQDQAVELNGLVDQYDNILRSLLDLYAPLKWQTVTLRPSAPRYKSGSGIQLGYYVIVSNTFISATLSTI